MRIECISMKGTGITNEDAYVINQTKQLFAVIDGVSALIPYENEFGQTGGALAAQAIKRQLEAAEDESDLAHELEKANSALRDKMIAANIDQEKKEALWGAACAVVRVKEGYIEYAQTGDCMIFAVYSDDTVRPLTYPQVSHLERRVFARWEEGIAEGLSTRQELHERCIEMLISNRYQANASGGYGVLNGDPCSYDFTEAGRINRIDLHALVMLTDGLFQPKAYGKAEPRWEETVLPIVHKGLQRYTDELLALENGDPECTQYVRFKKSDDKTGIVIYF